MDKREQLIYLTESGVITYEKRLNWYAELNDRPISSLLTSKEKVAFSNFTQKFPLEHFQQIYDKERIKTIVLGDKNYPKWLAETYKPPLVLFCQGNISYLNSRCLSVVGSRKMTPYGKIAMQHILPGLLDKFTIVSGLALGVDGEAHRITIHNKGRTIAVIGTGLKFYYPNAHQELQKLLSHSQLLVSLLPYYAGIKRWHFPYRNQTIAGLSEATLVIEAAAKSGSLITANYALQENREVFAVPGNINNLYSAGCNLLIQSGAKMVLDDKDIIEELL